MSNRLKLRPYQVETVNDIHAAWDSGIRRPAAVLATGLGKTVIFSHLADELVGAGRRPLILVHRDELVRQTVSKLTALAPDRSVGVIKAQEDNGHQDITVASVQTLGRTSRLTRYPTRHWSDIIVDECHHATAASYRSILNHQGAFSDGARAVGFTATLQRGDGDGLGAVWESVVSHRDIVWGIRNGFLVDVAGKAVQVDDLDLGQVARRNGDYSEGDLGTALISSGAGKIVAEAYLEECPDEQGIVFTPNIESAYYFADEFRAAGLTAEVVIGATPAHERQDIYRRVAARETQILVNCMVLTEGFDMPQLSVAVIARVTSSTALYVQMAGRVLRPWPGKTGALILDVTGVSRRHRLASIADLSENITEAKEAEERGDAYDVEGETEEDAYAASLIDRDAVRRVDVDLFAESASAWLRTYGGTWFLPTKTTYLFLWADENGTGPDSWKIGRTQDQYRLKGPLGSWLHKDLPLQMAMSVAEGMAAELDSTLMNISDRAASWRRGRTPASDAQKGQLNRLKVPYQEDVSKGEASDLISTAYASKILDPR